MHQERRKHPRFTALLKTTGRVGQESFPLVCSNIGPGGAHFSSRVALPVKARLSVSLRANGHNAPFVELIGDVVWSSPLGGTQPAGVGVRWQHAECTAGPEPLKALLLGVLRIPNVAEVERTSSRTAIFDFERHHGAPHARSATAQRAISAPTRAQPIAFAQPAAASVPKVVDGSHRHTDVVVPGETAFERRAAARRGSGFQAFPQLRPISGPFEAQAEHTPRYQATQPPAAQPTPRVRSGQFLDENETTLPAPDRHAPSAPSFGAGTASSHLIQRASASIPPLVRNPSGSFPQPPVAPVAVAQPISRIPTPPPGAPIAVSQPISRIPTPPPVPSVSASQPVSRVHTPPLIATPAPTRASAPLPVQPAAMPPAFARSPSDSAVSRPTPTPPPIVRVPPPSTPVVAPVRSQTPVPAPRRQDPLADFPLPPALPVKPVTPLPSTISLPTSHPSTSGGQPRFRPNQSSARSVSQVSGTSSGFTVPRVAPIQQTDEARSWPTGVPRVLAERYSDLTLLGQGGHGVVFRAHDLLLERFVVLKFLAGTGMAPDQARRYFLREFKVSADLLHPNIVRLYDIGNADGTLYYTMEYVPGHPLGHYLGKRDRLDDHAFVYSVFAQLASALDHAHKHGVLHRDVKPNNVLVADDGTVRLFDFGLARLLADGGRDQSMVVGTPFYMAPEMQKTAPIDHRADQYALGVVLYRMLTGRVPFADGNVFVAHAIAPVPDPRVFNTDLAAAIVPILMKMLAKNPEERYASCAAAAAELFPVLTSSARP